MAESSLCSAYRIDSHLFLITRFIILQEARDMSDATASSGQPLPHSPHPFHGASINNIYDGESVVERSDGLIRIHSRTTTISSKEASL